MLSRALHAWRHHLGETHVETSPAALASASTATYATHQQVSAILRPGSTAEVQACLRVANEFATPVYPVSRGKNWGYGSRVPQVDGGVLIDLGRMDRILRFDEDLAYVTVEPGVTFQQLHDFLERRGSTLMLSGTGASPDASVLANALERGLGLGPTGERANHVCDLEVVLPTGELVHPGFGRFGDSAIAPLSRSPPGPGFDGLFFQSNLGAVTRMTVWLTERPRDFRPVFVTASDAAELPALIEGVRSLFRAGVLRSNVGLWNAQKLAAAGVKAGRTPAWSGVVSLYSASEEEGRAKAAFVRATLARKGVRLLVLDRRAHRIGRALAPLAKLGGFELERLLERWFERSPYLGYPETNAMKPAYAAKRGGPATGDLDADRVGYVWTTASAPLLSEHALAVVKILEEAGRTNGLEPHLALRCENERLLQVLAGWVYDRDRAGADARAIAAHDQASDRLNRAGYLPFRLGVHSMRGMPAASDDSDDLLRRLKALLDPRNIFAPGRYSPSPALEATEPCSPLPAPSPRSFASD